MITKQMLARITPVRAGIVLGIFYCLVGLVFAPFFLFAAFIGSDVAFENFLVAVVLPVIYAVFGFIGGIIGAALYNVVAQWTGGLEFEVRNDTNVA